VLKNSPLAEGAFIAVYVLSELLIDIAPSRLKNDQELVP
jgi:hypothetical protein